jgi:hypothetical protein
MSRFRVDTDAMDQASAALGLLLDVRVFVRRYEYPSGRYIGVRGGVHHIGVDRDLSAPDASRTLWHELTHALQAERLGGHKAFERQWWAEMREIGLSRRQASRASGRRYRRTALEAEAARNERRHSHLALAVSQRRSTSMLRRLMSAGAQR